MIGSERAHLKARTGSNQFAYTIETDQDRLLGGAAHPELALAMFRAAQQEFAGRTIAIRHAGLILATSA